MMQEAVGNCVPMQILGNVIINIKVQTAFLAAKLSVSEEIEGWGGGGGEESHIALVWSIIFD